MKTYLGIEFGSTRIKAFAIDDAFQPVSDGSYTWKSRYENGEIYTKLYNKSLEGEADCGGILVYNYIAGEGGPYGMALLAAYKDYSCISLEAFLAGHVFKDARSTTVKPEKDDIDGFNSYIEKFKSGLAVQKAAIENI